MSYSSKLFWFIYWYIFICVFGIVDVELFVVINFLMAFFTVFNYIVPLISFVEHLNFIIKVINVNSKFNVFLLEYLKTLFSNVIKTVKFVILSVITLNLCIKVLIVNCYNVGKNVFYKTFVLKRRKLKTIVVLKKLFNFKMMLDAKSMSNIFSFFKK